MYNDYNVIHETSIIDMFWVYFLIIVIVLILIIIMFSLSKIFKKASIKPLIAYIPFYNVYKLLEICGLPKINLLLLFIPFINLYPLIKITFELANCFEKDTKFKLLLFFFPFIGLPILGLTNEKYVGINNERVNAIFIDELKKEEVVEKVKSEVVRQDTKIGMGSNNIIKEESITSVPNELKVDTKILNQQKKVDDEYVECPNCHNKVKKIGDRCFWCGQKL